MGGQIGRNKRARGQGRTQDFPRLLGELLCLHFANTVEGPISDRPEEFLSSYADLVRWSWHASVITNGEIELLTEVARTHPDQASAVFARALALRGAIDRAFRAIARSALPDSSDLARIRQEYVAALAHARLASSDGRFEWTWQTDANVLDRPLWPVARSAVDTLTGADLSRVRICPGAADCGWLFYDTSRNGRRRWCSMEGCGSRVKMRRHYASRRPGPATTTLPR